MNFCLETFDGTPRRGVRRHRGAMTLPFQTNLREPVWPADEVSEFPQIMQITRIFAKICVLRVIRGQTPALIPGGSHCFFALRFSTALADNP